VLCGLIGILTCTLGLGPAQAQTRPAFEFLDGDRVVLLGDTLIEREQLCGYVEERLTVEFPKRNVTFRNLGWSADTPAGASRASFDFDKPGKGFEKLKEHLSAARPTVVMVGYGMASSFAGAAGLPQFKTELNRLLDAISSLGTNGPVRLVLLSPIRHEDLGAPLPNPTSHNQQLALYSSALQEIANQSGCDFISLFDLLGEGTKNAARQPLTDNGIHLTEFGYVRLAEAVEQGLHWQPNHWSVTITADGESNRSQGTKISGLSRTKDSVRFRTLDDQLVNPLLLGKNAKRAASLTPTCQIQIQGLKPGLYELRIDGASVLSATDKEWKRGVNIETGPQFEQAEALRQVILRKNELYFDRFRPQNETYLFGFRKYEQGQNAKEIPMFDPLVEAEEAKIAKLRQPIEHEFELVRTEAVVKRQPASLPPPISHHVEEGQHPGTSTPPPFEVAAGLEVNLFAESPLLAKPIEMNFDLKGRLWVASSAVYPQIQPGQKADDKILVLEDTDGDGFAEKSTVFAEGLLIPTGVVPGDGGAYVGQSTELLHFKDTDGDGRADEKRVVLSGFGTEDTHHIVHTLHWGYDGQLYFNQSIYIHTHIETPHGVERLNSGGVWHLRPPTMELGIFLRGFCNPWGHQFDAFGQSFVTDGAGSSGLNYGLPGATFFTYANMRRELKSISPGSYPKFCGLEIIRSPHFPPEWQGNAITCDFRAHRVVRFAIEESGAGFAAREVADVLRSTNVTFRPIDAKLGPDGALYLADWSNPIIQHGEVDFRDPRRDHEHGRIWRITVKGRPLDSHPRLVEASNKDLLDQLLLGNACNQQQARRVLTERGAKIRNDLAKWAKAQTSEAAQLEALWMYQAIDALEPALLEKLLHAKDGHIRAAATRVVAYWHPRLKRAEDILALRVADEHPRVRLEAIRALAQIPSTRSTALVLGALERPMDSFLDYAIWLSINDLAQPWLAAVKSGEWKPDGREKQLEFALKALEPSLAGEVLGRVLQTREIGRDGSGPWIELIGAAGNEALLRRLFDQVLQKGFDEPASVRALEALGLAFRQRSAKPSGALGDIQPLLSHSNQSVREQALRLAGNWKLKQFIPQMITLAADKNAPVGARQAAFDALRDIGGTQVSSGLKPLTEKASDSWGRQQAVLTLAALDPKVASQTAVAMLLETTDENEAATFWRSLLTIKGIGPVLAHALPKSGLPPAMARTGLRAAREGGRNEPDLVWALTRGADLEGEAQTLSAAEIQQLASSVTAEGDPARGERIFRRKDLACITCHAIGGVGGKVGPDLTSIGASAQIDYLIESVLYPNRKIKEGYHSAIIETKDGTEYSGVVARESSEELVLRDATDKEISIPKQNIEKRSTGNSLMPGGLVDPLSPGERLDLYRFLSELGKPGPFDASKGSVARSWKLLAQTLDVAQFGDEKVLSTGLGDKKWTLARSLVDGRLLKESLAASLEDARVREPHAVYAAAPFQVSKAGAISFKLAGADGFPTWIDGKPMPSSADFRTELSAGKHTLILKLDAKKLPDAIRAESPEATFLNAGAQDSPPPI
jgi:putative heme-binding domain-containing protein